MRNILTSILACLLCCLSASAQHFQLPLDSKTPGEIRVLCIGNSFTYVHDTDKLLQQIAASQGLTIDIGKNLVGGYTFRKHLENEKSIEAVDFGGYDYAFLQDQSANPARYSRDRDKTVLKDLKTLKRNVKAHSPKCKVILERTWTYGGAGFGGFDSEEDLEYHLARGAAKMARRAGTGLSPIGAAFKDAESLMPSIKLLGPDNHHQSLEGAYLKACVNYLIISKKPFTGNPDCCGVDPETAAFLRSVAEKNVLKSN